MAALIDPAAVRPGRVRGRYFRENFAQGGFDLVQVLPELVTNADAAIAAAGRAHGRIEISVGPPDPSFLADWRRELRRLRVPAFPVWRYEVRCTDDGEGVDAEVVERRLGALGVVPEHASQRGLFGRGLCDVWLAQGGGRIEGVRGERAVESWFFPARGDDPFAYVHVRDDTDVASMRRALGIGSGSRVTVPLPGARLPAVGRVRTMVANLVQLRPVLEDPSRELWLSLPDRPAELVVFSPPEPDPERPVLFDEEVEVTRDVRARIVVRRAAAPIALTPQRALRRGGLLVRSGRAAHEVTLGSVENLPGARHLYGEVRCDAIEAVQRAALDSPRPQLVVKADRTGLNEHHPLVQRLYTAIDEVLRPIVTAEERRAGAHLVTAARAIRARDEVGLRELNDALRSAFDAPGRPDSRAAAVHPGMRPQRMGTTRQSPASRRHRLARRAMRPTATSGHLQSSRRCASSSSSCGCTRASRAASPCCSTPRASRPARQSSSSPTPGCDSSCGRKRCLPPTRAAGPG